MKFITITTAHGVDPVGRTAGSTLTLMMSENNANAMIKLMQTDPIDISELISGAISRIENKNIDEAVVGLANISRNSDFDTLKKSADKHLKSSLSRLFGSTFYSADSRVIAKTNGGFNQSGEDYELQLESQIQQEYSIDIELSIRGSIYPAFEQFLLEHTISKEYIETTNPIRHNCSRGYCPTR